MCTIHLTEGILLYLMEAKLTLHFYRMISSVRNLDFTYCMISSPRNLDFTFLKIFRFSSSDYINFYLKI